MPKDKVESTAVAKRGPKGASKPLTDKDFQKLLNMVRIQCTMEECCSVLEMSDTTLNRRLKEMNYNNFEDLYKRHNDDKSEVHANIEQQHVIDLTRIPDDQLDAIEKAFNRIEDRTGESGEV